VHYQTLSWARIPRKERDTRLYALGISSATLQNVRANEPEKRIVEAAKVALSIDDEPNTDFIEYIAGYAPRSAVYHYFNTRKELFDVLGSSVTPKIPPPLEIPQGSQDIVSLLPSILGETAVHLDYFLQGARICVWQKVNGGMRRVELNRVVQRTLFLSGVLLYAGEGTKSLLSGRVEIANSDCGIMRIYLRFIQMLGFSTRRLRARVQIHDLGERNEAVEHWSRELGLPATQFVEPLLSLPSKLVRRHTYTLQLSLANTMLLLLMRHWTGNLEQLIWTLDRGAGDAPRDKLNST